MYRKATKSSCAWLFARVVSWVNSLARLPFAFGMLPSQKFIGGRLSSSLEADDSSLVVLVVVSFGGVVGAVGVVVDLVSVLVFSGSGVSCETGGTGSGASVGLLRKL